MTRIPDPADVRRRVDMLADALADAGSLTDDRWRSALHAVPRHFFVPDAAWVKGSGRISRLDDPQAWLDAVYSDQAIVTQLDDGDADVGAGQGDYTSSLSAPSVVVEFLELLQPLDGDEVLDVGTGTGWTAGLLSHWLGDGNVTSVEVDPAVAEVAVTNLKEAGFTPNLVVGDGADGVPEGALFAGVHVTCGVSTVPYAWVEQTRPGGLIVFPWMPEHQGGHKTVLTVLADGTAVGRFHGGASYMMLRSQRAKLVDRPYEGEWRESSTRVDPRRVINAAWGADVAIAGMLPAVVSRLDASDDGRLEFWLQDEGSTAMVTHAPGYGLCAVLQRGPRDLWDEMWGAFCQWVRWGLPARSRFGMTVGPDGQQVWLDDPERVLTLQPVV